MSPKLSFLQRICRTEKAGTNRGYLTRMQGHACVLSHQLQGLQSFQSLAEHITLLSQGNLLLHAGQEPEELAQLLESAAEACG